MSWPWLWSSRTEKTTHADNAPKIPTPSAAPAELNASPNAFVESGAEQCESGEQALRGYPPVAAEEEDGGALPESITVSREKVYELMNTLKRLHVLHNDLLVARSRSLYLRDQCMYERKDFNYKRDYLLESSRKVIDMLPENCQNTPNVDLSTLSRQLASDHTELEKSTERLQNADSRLSQAETSIQSQEKDVSQVTASAIRVLRGLDLPGTADLEDMATPSQSRLSPLITPSSPEMHPLLDQYYEAKGREFVMSERLADLIQEYEEARVDRNQLEDQGQPVEPPNDAFEAEYEAAHVEAAGNLKLATESAAAAKQACVLAGVDKDLQPLSREENAAERVQTWIEHSSDTLLEPTYLTPFDAGVEPELDN